LWDEHVALGADMHAYAWAGMAMPWSYRTSPAEEQRAVRERAGLCDASQLQVVSIRGAGAVACLERLVPRRIADMAVGSSRFTVLLSRFGRICDEALVLRLAEDELWLSHGAGATRTQLARLEDFTEAPEVRVSPLDELHVLSLQGPSSAEVLGALASEDVDQLPFLGHRRVKVGAHDVVLSRSGFTGELGFEIFCQAADAVPLWRLLLAAGAPVGLLPYGYRSVDLLRIEAGFTLYPSDLGSVSSLWEAGLGWLLRDKVGAYVGHDAVAKAKGSATHRFCGVRLQGDVAVARGASVRLGGRVIGVVTSSAASPSSGETLCLAHVERDAVGTDPPVAVGAPTPADAAAPVQTGRLVPLPFRPRRGGTAPA
jgi:aminomethyltransferase